MLSPVCMFLECERVHCSSYNVFLTLHPSLVSYECKDPSFDNFLLFAIPDSLTSNFQ